MPESVYAEMLTVLISRIVGAVNFLYAHFDFYIEHIICAIRNF